MQFKSIKIQLITILILVAIWPIILIAISDYNVADKLVKDSFNTSQLRSEAFQRSNAINLQFDFNLEEVKILASSFVIIDLLYFGEEDFNALYVGDFPREEIDTLCYIEIDDEGFEYEICDYPNEFSEDTIFDQDEIIYYSEEDFYNEIRDSLEYDIRAFQQITGGSSGFYSIKILDDSGIVRFSTDRNEEDLDLSNDSKFNKGMKKEFVIYEQGEDGNRSLVIVVPVIDETEGNPIGVVIATTGTELTDKILLDRTALTDTGETYIVNEDGMMISDSRFIQDAAFNQHINAIPLTECFSNGKNFEGNYIDYRGVEVYGVSQCNQDLGYVLISQIDTSEINAPLSNLVESYLQIGGIVIFIVIIVAILLGRSLSKPIIELRQMAFRITQGDFNTKMQTSSKNEIGSLVESFNVMAEELKKKIELEKELGKTEEKIKSERLTIVGNLSSNIAHDLRNPLGAIRNSTQRIELQNGEKNSIITEEINRINRSIKRMSHQVEGVLNYVRQTPLSVRNTAVSDILNATIETLDIPENIQINSPKNNISIECDLEKISIVFENIILNAIQAIGQNKGNISISLSEKDNFVSIDFTNDGPTIPDEILSEIFEPLFTSKLKGTGLGLSSCKSMIEQHKGTLTASTNPVTFTIRIPKNVKI